VLRVWVLYRLVVSHPAAAAATGLKWHLLRLRRYSVNAGGVLTVSRTLDRTSPALAGQEKRQSGQTNDTVLNIIGPHFL
jgi:hypothetical protein